MEILKLTMVRIVFQEICGYYQHGTFKANYQKDYTTVSADGLHPELTNSSFDDYDMIYVTADSILKRLM
jgi:hypothetical protein